jgi:hypothetical protein
MPFPLERDEAGLPASARLSSGPPKFSGATSSAFAIWRNEQIQWVRVDAVRALSALIARLASAKLSSSRAVWSMGMVALRD